MPSPEKHVGILLLKSPEWSIFQSVVRLSVALLDEKARLTLFLMDDAVLGLYPRQPGKPLTYPLYPIIEKGGTVLVCQSTAEPRGLTADRLPSGVRFETQVRLGRLADEVDLFLPFV
ncbi:DsrE family protein [Leptospirillum ferriphilum]|uniref:Uncharacterized protein n=4 Tax=Leptospirillum TaxID=179 RepID=A0A059XSG1_9BACT|nr:MULTISPECIES: DsrE family protein [Leptospirillum]EAY57714.1 MAG: protein of unknown function [Leptospirillum rubarum]EDZ39485.1 MAG: Protein of unknown function [Leptospirillum sp. Group II '5-way CG']EIJ77054.1 MAG: hypothetical protein C75L2_00030051 [Leptospirillum sp. Group II 'C75']MCL5259779.1 DsrE family protein [Nitrospirota bacterium]AFS52598.1 hypothetical protein LFML04_0356 [Leptospirillum ferriphilum ML-04]